MRFLLLFISMLFWMASAEADQSLPEDGLTIELRALAKDFARIIEKHGGGAVAIGEFSASTDVRGSVGPQVQLVLARELRALRCVVDNERYKFEIKGDYQPIVDKSTDLLGIKLVGRLIDRETGEPLAEKPTGRFVFGAETVPAMIGLNVSGSPTQDPRELSDRFKEAGSKPQVVVAGSRIRGQTEQFGIEMIVKEEGRYVARPVTTDSAGRPFLPLQQTEVYGVRLINHSSHETAVDLCIDGINVFAFSDKPARYWILDPKSSLDVLGWHLTDTRSAEFKVVAEYPQSAAAKLKLKSSARIGLITASFSASWAKESNRPDDEPTLTGRGTGFGAEISFDTKSVKRTIGTPRDMISVRYER